MPGIAEVVPATNVTDSSSSSSESLPATPENTPSEAATPPVMTNREITQTDKINKRLLESLLNRMQTDLGHTTTNGTDTTTQSPGSTRSLNDMLQMGRGSDDEDDAQDASSASDEWR